MNIEKCPYCGNTEFVKGKQDAYAKIYPINKIFTLKSQALYHIICLNCGAVVKSYVNTPETLKTKS